MQPSFVDSQPGHRAKTNRNLCLGELVVTSKNTEVLQQTTLLTS